MGNDFINTNFLKTMDWIVSGARELLSSLFNNSNIKIRDTIRNAIFEGMEIGEFNKEQAIISAMRDVGFD